MRALTLATLGLLVGSGVATAKKVAVPPPAPKQNPVFAKSSVADWNAVPAPTTEPKFTPPTVKRQKLKNGITLLVVENHTLPIVSMEMVVMGAGSARDPNGKGGVASLTADMLDEGAGGLSSLQISQESDRLGASIWVDAGADTARVNVQTLTKTLEPTIDLAAKILTQPTFDATELARVQADAVTELELRRDRPREVAQLVLDAALYGAATPYGHPNDGTKDEVKALALADLQTFYKEHWQPSAMTIVVAGDVDAATVKGLLDKALGTWKPKGGKPVGKVAVKAQRNKDRLLLVDRAGAAQSDVRIGLVGIDRKDKRYFGLEVLSTALGGSFTSRLNHRLREELGITYGIGAGMRYRVGLGEFEVSSAIVSPSTAQGVSEIFTILDDLGKTDIPAEELDKAKQNVIRSLPALFETNTTTAGTIADLVVFGLPDNYYATYAAGIRKVTAKDVKGLAKTLVPSGKMTISIVGDMSVVRPELDKLNFAPTAMFDLYGVPVTAPK